MKVIVAAVLLALGWPFPVRADPLVMARTPPATWKTGGYQQLRFGMGPGDVADALRDSGKALHSDSGLRFTEPNGDISGAHVEGHGLVIAGKAVEVTVLFYRGCLFRIILQAMPTQSPALSEPWFKAVVESVSAKYGTAKSCDPQAGDCYWLRGDAFISVHRMFTVVSYNSVSINATIEPSFYREEMPSPTRKPEADKL